MGNFRQPRRRLERTIITPIERIRIFIRVTFKRVCANSPAFLARVELPQPESLKSISDRQPDTEIDAAEIFVCHVDELANGKVLVESVRWRDRVQVRIVPRQSCCA